MTDPLLLVDWGDEVERCLAFTDRVIATCKRFLCSHKHTVRVTPEVRGCIDCDAVFRMSN